MTPLEWIIAGGIGFVLIIHSVLMIGSVFVFGELKNRLDKLEGKQ